MIFFFSLGSIEVIHPKDIGSRHRRIKWVKACPIQFRQHTIIRPHHRTQWHTHACTHTHTTHAICATLTQSLTHSLAFERVCVELWKAGVAEIKTKHCSAKRDAACKRTHARTRQPSINAHSRIHNATPASCCFRMRHRVCVWFSMYVDAFHESCDIWPMRGMARSLLPRKMRTFCVSLFYVTDFPESNHNSVQLY